MPYIGQVSVDGSRMFTEEGWVPIEDVPGPQSVDTGDGGDGGRTYTPGQPAEPSPNDYWVKVDDNPSSPSFGSEIPASPNEPGAWFNTYSYNKDLADYLEFGTPGGPGGGAGPRGPTAAELAVDRERIHASNLATYLDATVAQIQTEIDAKRLSTEQAEGEFNRRLDAFAEAGAQMSNLWQWTVPPGAETIHSDLRANLGMEPWESQPMSWDPYAMAMDIVESTPDLTTIGVPSTDPIQQALDLAGQFV